MPDPIATQVAAVGPGAVTHLIQVHCDPSTLTLTVSLSRVSLNPGDTVVWSFLGIPTGWTPWIEFRQAGNNVFVGPLEGLTQAPGGIWGVCRPAGWEGTDPIPFEYRAMIQRGFAAGWETEGSLVWSAPVHLDVQPSVVGRELTWEVTFDAMAEMLLVEPLVQTLWRGDTIVWSFPSDLPGGEAAWRPRIKFHLYEGTGTLVLNQQLGPFGSLSILPGRLRGTGNNGVDGIYHFEVALVSIATGQIGWTSSGDPVIDNRGGVITPDDPEPLPPR